VPASWVEGTEFSKAAVVSAGDLVVAEGAEVRSFLALLVQKYKYCVGVGRRSGCGGGCGGTQFSHFTGIKLQILTRRKALALLQGLFFATVDKTVFSLYWYNSTNTDSAEGACACRDCSSELLRRRLALLVQEYKY
jgi:hypothetical protein